MSIKHSIWKIHQSNESATSEKLSVSSLDLEETLEELITKDISILNEDWLLIGRQVQIEGKKIDLLAINGDGTLIIIELKRKFTSRDVVAQALDYASLVESHTPEQLEEIYANFSGRTADSLEHGFKQKFNVGIAEKNITLNSKQQMVIVAAELDESTERIVNYLNKNLNDGAMIGVMFFSVFQDGETQYLSRSWLIEPEVQENLNKANSNWNNEVYCNFGIQEDGEGRSWEDARKYGFVAAGGGRWYSRTLRNLKEGERIWVNIPRYGYAGVGYVVSEPMTINQFLDKKHISQDALKGSYWFEEEHSLDDVDYVVQVEWIHTVPKEQAVSGALFGNQNTVARPIAAKWGETVNTLKQQWAAPLKKADSQS